METGWYGVGGTAIGLLEGAEWVAVSLRKALWRERESGGGGS